MGRLLEVCVESDGWSLGEVKVKKGVRDGGMEGAEADNAGGGGGGGGVE